MAMSEENAVAAMEIVDELVAEAMQETVAEKQSKLEARDHLDSVTGKMIDEAMEGMEQTDAADRNQAEEEPAQYQEAFEKGRIAGLQEAVLTIMGKNGTITDQMRKDVMDNVYHDSLINWIKSFYN